MSKKTNSKADWRITTNRSFSYIGRLGTPKGFGYVKGDNEKCLEISVSLRIFTNGIDTEKWANVETKDLDNYEEAHAWVESILL